jgi:hypothetical protein
MYAKIENCDVCYWLEKYDTSKFHKILYFEEKVHKYYPLI